jgi:hypothetical protein
MFALVLVQAALFAWSVHNWSTGGSLWVVAFVGCMFLVTLLNALTIKGSR